MSVISFGLPGDEIQLLLRLKNEHKVAKSAENVDWESVHQKYNKILERSKAEMENPFSKRHG